MTARPNSPADSMPKPRGRLLQCVTCQSPELARIDAALVSGVGAAAVARKFGLSKDSVYRHFKSHISADRKAQLIYATTLKSLAQRAADSDMSLMEYSDLVRGVVVKGLMASATNGDLVNVANLSGRTLDVLRFQASLTGQLRENVTNNLTITNNFLHDSGFLQFQADLVRVLSRFPEALAAVTAEFERIAGAPQPEQLAAIEHEPQPSKDDSSDEDSN